MPRVTFIADIVTPYTAAVLRALATRCELAAIFCASTGSRGLPWNAGPLPANSRVLDGLCIPRRSRDGPDYHPSPSILAAIARTRPDVIISGNYSFPSLYAAGYAWLTGAGLIIYCDGTARSEDRVSVVQRASRWLLARTSKAAAALSDPAAERFAELGWASDSIFRPLHTTEVAAYHAVGRRRQYGARPSLSVLSVGRLIPRKGIEHLIDAVQLARQRGAEVDLQVVGSGPLLEPLQARAVERGVPVRWHGFIDQQHLPEVYASADAFAFCTRHDPFGMVLFEAAAAGLPLIASRHAGATAELVDGQGSGLMVEPTDIDALADAICRLAADPPARERMGRTAHALTLSRTPDAAAHEYMRAVDRALGEARR